MRESGSKPNNWGFPDGLLTGFEHSARQIPFEKTCISRVEKKRENPSNPSARQPGKGAEEVKSL